MPGHPGVIRDDLDARVLIQAYETGESAASLARRFDANIWTILKRLRAAGVRIRSRVEQNERRLNLDKTGMKELRAVVDGLLLGDGSIDPKGLLRLEQARVRHGRLKELAARLMNLGGTSRIVRIPPRERLLDGRKIKSSGGYLLYTPAFVELQAERRRWYPKGKKIVPRDIDLSPLALAYWLAGDGTYSRSGNLVFCTNSFKRSETQFLADELNRLYGVRALVMPVARPGEFHVGVNRRDDAVRIKDRIEAFVPACCRYKLRFVRPTLSLAERNASRYRHLTTRQVRQIQVSRRNGTSITVLAMRYGVSPPSINAALRRIL